MLMARGQVREAAAAYRLALKLSPANSLAAFSYGILLLGQHRFEEALAVFDQVLERSPFDATLRGFKGWAHMHLGNPEEALASYSQARAIDASNPFGFYGPGFVTAAIGELAASAEWFERAAKVDPNDAELFAWAAIMHLSLDDTASATRFAAKAVELNPMNTVPLGARALAHVFAGEDDRAVEVARRGLLPDVVRLRNEAARERSDRGGDRCLRGGLPDARDRVAVPELPRGVPRSIRWANSPGPPSTSPTSDRWPGTSAEAERLIDRTRATHEHDPYLGYLWLYGPGALRVELALVEGRHEAALGGARDPRGRAAGASAGAGRSSATRSTIRCGTTPAIARSSSDSSGTSSHRGERSNPPRDSRDRGKAP